MKVAIIVVLFLSSFIIETQTYVREGKEDYKKVLLKYLRQEKDKYKTVIYKVTGEIPIEILIFTII
jgi:hypothetical protein